MSTIEDFSGQNPTWCPGCGNWGIGMALKKALVELGYEPSSVFVVFGIGCSGNMNDFLNAYAMHSLHGRSIPNAIGIKLARHTKPVIAVVGDGDCYGEGGNHFMHACRGNHDITVVVHHNSLYGLTTGQAAPTAQKGFKSKSTPSGIIEAPLNPLTLALTQGATFIAQGFAGKMPELAELIKKAMQHKGFSVLNVLQPCVSFNKVNTYEYYQERIYLLTENYDPEDYEKALEICTESLRKEKFPIGVLYKVDKPTYTDSLPQLHEKELIDKERYILDDELLTAFE